jgi:hypothetical protein
MKRRLRLLSEISSDEFPSVDSDIHAGLGGRILPITSDPLLCGVLERCYPDDLRRIAGIT